jgi:hypothetical protein
MTEPVPPAPSAQPSPLGGLDAPPENVQRGVALALIVLPLGVVVWDLLWSFGFVASIVGFGVAWGAVRLYRLGSNGPFSRTGALAVTIITVVTLVVAFVSGFAVDLVGYYAGLRGVSIPEALVTPEFWGGVGRDMTTGSSLLSLLLAAGFGLLGCFSILRSAFRGTRPATAPLAPGGPYGTATTPPVPPAPRLTQDDDPPRS